MLRSKMVTDKYDPELIKKYVDLLCESDKLGIFFSSKKNWESEKDSFKKATFYDTPYDVKDFSEELLNKIKNPKCEITSKKLDLPPKNTMIPKNFEVLAENKEKSEKPTLIFQDENTDLWYHKDDEFHRPKAVVQLRMYLKESDPVMGLMYQQIIDQHLKEYTYLAEAASLNFDLAVNKVSVDLTWSGFNDSMPAFIKETLIKIG
jgi:insulysin